MDRSDLVLAASRAPLTRSEPPSCRPTMPRSRFTHSCSSLCVAPSRQALTTRGTDETASRRTQTKREQEERKLAKGAGGSKVRKEEQERRDDTTYSRERCLAHLSQSPKDDGAERQQEHVALVALRVRPTHACATTRTQRRRTLTRRTARAAHRACVRVWVRAHGSACGGGHVPSC